MKRIVYICMGKTMTIRSVVILKQGKLNLFSPYLLFCS